MYIEFTSESNSMSARDRVVEKLKLAGVPPQVLDQSQQGLIVFVKHNKPKITELVSAILPTHHEAAQISGQASESGSRGFNAHATLRDIFRESLVWLQWLMFEDDPVSVLKDLSNTSVGQRGFCGAVWGSSDIAYRCRTCEHDPTCAVCVSCFQNGNHRDHDYSIIYTGGGCCDCGDATAWKREGFCSRHKGSEQILPLPQEYASCAEPVLDFLLIYWREMLLSNEVINPNDGVYHDADQIDIADELTYVLVGMLVEFCRCSESLLSLVSKRVFSSTGLLDLLVMAERFLKNTTVEIVHEFLLKLLGEPSFKYEFSKVFLNNYAKIVKEAIQVHSNATEREHPMLSTFSVQIFTVPTLTIQLVREMNLLEVLMGSLADIFSCCAADDGRLQANKWMNLRTITMRVVEDLRFALSHKDVPPYIMNEHPDIMKMWVRLLVSVQGMDPQRRERHIHIEEENNTIMYPFFLGRSFANIHSAVINGVCLTSSPDIDDEDDSRHVKVGRLSKEFVNYGDASSVPSCSLNDDDDKCNSIPLAVIWMARNCVRALDDWLCLDKGLLRARRLGGLNFLAVKEALSKARKRDDKIPRAPFTDSDKNRSPLPTSNRDQIFDKGKTFGPHILRLLGSCEWPRLTVDGSSYGISMHIPLHRFLSLLLIKAFEKCYEKVAAADGRSLPPQPDFFHLLFGGCHPHGFSAHVMEHPLEIRVFCAQVRAGMWRRNGDSVEVSCTWYRSFPWGGQDLELDLFLLQCCASFAPADDYVTRIIERFGLLSYFNLSRGQPSEHEAVLVLEMLVLFINVLQERRFCGQTAAESLRRELICRLSVGDSARSQLLKFVSRDLSKSDQFQEILNDVASFAKPAGLNQGKYSLRLHCWKELNLYYPRWNVRELQTAEERYLQICGSCALVSQLPKWTGIYPPLEGLARVATCSKMVHIIRSVICFSLTNDDAGELSVPDTVLITALHLLALVLDVCDARGNSFGETVHLIAFSDGDFRDHVAGESGKLGVFQLLIYLKKLRKKKEAEKSDVCSLAKFLLKRLAEMNPDCMDRLRILDPELVGVGPATDAGESDSEKWKMKARARQAAVMEKMKADQSRFLKDMKSESSTGSEDEESVCSLCHDSGSSGSLSYLIQLQKSALVSCAGRGCTSWDESQRAGNTCSRLPLRSVTFQFTSKPDSPEAVTLPEEIGSPKAVDEEGSGFDEMEEELYISIQKNMWNTDVPSLIDERGQSEFDAVDSKLVRRYLGSLPVKKRGRFSAWKMDCGSSSNPVASSTLVPAYDGFSPFDSDGVHLSSCGHAVHQRCVDRYLYSLRERRIHFGGGLVADPDKGELLCPVCRCLANSLFPCRGGPAEEPKVSLSSTGSDALYFHQGLCLLRSAAIAAGTEVCCGGGVPSQSGERATLELETALRCLQEMYFGGKRDVFSDTARLNPWILLWDTLKYTLTSMEIAARCAPETLSPVYGLSRLYASLGIPTGLILSSVLHTVRQMQSENPVFAIQRYRGLLLLAGSVCSASPSGTAGNERLERELAGYDGDVPYPDLRFWKRMSAPVISLDPFCSLMWCLFCLPRPFAVCADSFLRVVHVFHAVALTQAVIACCVRYGDKIRDAALYADSLVSDVDRAVSESRCFPDYFVPARVDASSSARDGMRRLCFPYLRRCALLWKLLQSAGVSDGAEESGAGSELDEIENAEKVFGVADLDIVLKDRVVRSMSRKWMEHFASESGGEQIKCRFFSVPSTPFQLLRLPCIYQELLERYIKEWCSEECHPALCLLCGKLCYDNPKPCCMDNGCQGHVASCGMALGLFLLIRKTHVLLYRYRRRDKLPSPYLDRFGEEDPDLQRGRPLYLNEERYAVLTSLVASHGLQKNFSLRQTDL